MLLENRVFERLVGQAEVARKIKQLQIRPDPEVSLYREALAALTASAGVTGAVGIALGLGVGVPLAVESAALAGGTVLTTVGATAGASALSVGGAPTGGGLLATFSSSLGALLPRAGMVAAAAALLVFVTPRASSADPAKPVWLDASLPRFVPVSPRDSSSVSLGRKFQVDGAEWRVAAIASNPAGD